MVKIGLRIALWSIILAVIMVLASLIKTDPFLSIKSVIWHKDEIAKEKSKEEAAVKKARSMQARHDDPLMSQDIRGPAD